jgi:hypothetical protein
MQKALILEKIHTLINLWNTRQIPTLAQHEIYPDLNKGERLNYLYFTLPICLNFQRSSPAMWQAAFQTFQDPDTNYLFFPEKVVQTDYFQVQQDLRKHKLSLQPNRHTHIWTSISQTLATNFQADPRILLQTFDHDVPKILEHLQVTHKKDFPYLSGLKLSNYWLYILSNFTDVQFQNAHQISIIPDTHIRQATVKLGLSERLPSPEKTEQLWRELLQDTGINPTVMHPILWNWSRNKFTPQV